LGFLITEIDEPFGVDTYFLLTTPDAIPNLLVLESEGVKIKVGWIGEERLRYSSFCLKLAQGGTKSKNPSYMVNLAAILKERI